MTMMLMSKNPRVHEELMSPNTFGLGVIDYNYNNINYWYDNQDLIGHELLGQKRKLNEIIFNQEFGKRRKIDNETIKLVCGSCYLPKDMEGKPNYQGEDAHFICHEGQTIGVADGVGGFSKKGIDSGEYARRLMESAKRRAMDMIGGAVDPRKVLNEAYQNNRGLQGASTACILTLNKESGELHGVNVGDSGFMLFRDNKLLYTSPIQQKPKFNCPYQLGNYNHSDRPESAVPINVKTLPGDIIVLGTDGLLDNMFPSEMEERLVRVSTKSTGKEDSEDLALVIANLALYNSFSKYNVTPFSMKAKEAGFEYNGGKIDDITVIVAHVVASYLTS